MIILLRDSIREKLQNPFSSLRAAVHFEYNFAVCILPHPLHCMAIYMYDCVIPGDIVEQEVTVMSHHRS